MIERHANRGSKATDTVNAGVTSHQSAKELARYRIRGMDCADEVAALKRALKDIVYVEDLRFDLMDGVMEVPASVSRQAVAERVARAGMRAEPIEHTGTTDERSWWERHGRSVLTTVSGLSVLAGFVAHAVLADLEAAVGSEGLANHDGIHEVPILAVTFYVVAVTTGLALVLPKAWYAVKNMRPDMNLLMTLAVAGAIGLGEWFEAGTVSFLFALSLTLESWSVGRARRAVEKLLSLAPPRVRVKRDDGTTEVEPADVPVGTIFIVRPGERIALDGVVVEGTSDVDQAPITGESVHVPKSVGDDVFAGTINGNGAIDVRSTKAASDTTLAQIIRMVGEARKDRADAERWVERFARVYTPVVFAVAGAVMLLPPLLLGASWAEWLYRGLVLLVIGCPCALVIATPVAVVAGLAASARHGVLVKGGRFLELPASIRVVALDKTGTLTQGRPEVVDVEALNEHTSQGLLTVAAAIESRSEHPIARAILGHANSKGIHIPRPEDVEIVPGKGTSGRVDDRRYWLGSHRWLEERQQETDELHAAIEQRSSAGRSVVVVGTDSHVCGFVTLADAIRPEAKQTVSELHNAGVEQVVMLTGDNQATASAVASQVGIDDMRAELLPADKVAAVEMLEREVGPVAMIGDGVNDAPALARATIGVAMGAAGTDVAIETADVALMGDDISKLGWLVRHSARTLRVIRQNTVFALGVKALFVVLTFAGVASLWGAIAADMGASLLVVFNALRLLRA